MKVLAPKTQEKRRKNNKIFMEAAKSWLVHSTKMLRKMRYTQKKVREIRSRRLDLRKKQNNKPSKQPKQQRKRKMSTIAKRMNNLIMRKLRIRRRPSRSQKPAFSAILLNNLARAQKRKERKVVIKRIRIHQRKRKSQKQLKITKSTMMIYQRLNLK